MTAASLSRPPTRRIGLPLALALLALASSAQAQRAGGAPDLNGLVLDWSRGRWGSPLVCEIEGEPRRVMRQVLIAPGPPDARPLTNRIRFSEVESERVTRCFREAAGDQPNLGGELVVTLPGPPRPDTASHDFEQALKQEGGFTLDVKSGLLRVADWGTERSVREIDFAGGRAKLRLPRRGSDDARALAGFEDRRVLLLDLIAPDGTELGFPLALIAPR